MYISEVIHGVRYVMQFARPESGLYSTIKLAELPTVVCHIDDDVIKWKHFPRYWSFVRGIHRSPPNFHHKGKWRGAVMFSLIGAWINGRVNNREAGDFRRHNTYCDVTVILNHVSAGFSNFRNNQIRYREIMRHKCVSKLGRHPFKYSGLLPFRLNAIAWNIAGVLSIGPLRANNSGTWINKQQVLSLKWIWK